MSEQKEYHLTCDLCGRDGQHGNEIYTMPYVKAWKVTLCEVCYYGNRKDGIVPKNTARWAQFIKRLEAKGVVIRLNDNGWLTIP
jgi:C4-type Zn-finger protein